MTAHTLLHVQDLHAGYGATPVLFGVHLSVRAGEMVTLLGRNGMGKTTTVRAIMGLNRPRGGIVRVDGAAVEGRPPHRIAKAGLGLVPEGRQIFRNLTVAEHLVAFGRAGGAARWTAERVYALFPALAERRGHFGGQLSGGEQQMLAIGRALTVNPKLLILDEATEGLAPLIRAQIWDALAALKRDGQALLVIDKHLEALTQLADRHFVIEKGRVVWSGSNAAFTAEAEIKARYLGV
jgi:branched-chain amino acid transport system ATP-binding protein